MAIVRKFVGLARISAVQPAFTFHILINVEALLAGISGSPTGLAFHCSVPFAASTCVKSTELAIANGEINAKPIPGLSMFVSHVMREAHAQVTPEADVVQPDPRDRGIHTLPPAHIIPNDVLMFL
ncbi:MAG TPA: hypothetical protein VK582_09755 [Pyrinomonadaceae bacterium]|nr:hypothetical protein [Pyrinomonadaceae bacterium]